MIYSDMPRFSQADLNMKAITSRASTDTMVENPSQMVSTKSASFMSFRTRYMTQVKARATVTPVSTSMSK